MNENVSLLLLLLLVSGRRTADGQATVVGCVPGTDVRNVAFDCSRRHIDFATLHHKSMEGTYFATSLNLAGNMFAPTIANYSFEHYTMLNDTLTLAANGFEHVESHAFFSRLAQLSKSLSKSKGLPADQEEPNPLMVFTLDLSANRLHRMPWQALASLTHLRRLVVTNNPLVRFDLADLDANQSRADRFRRLSHI